MFLNTVLSFHRKFTGHLVAVVAFEISIEQFVVARDASSDTRGVGGEDGAHFPGTRAAKRACRVPTSIRELGKSRDVSQNNACTKPQQSVRRRKKTSRLRRNHHKRAANPLETSPKLVRRFRFSPQRTGQNPPTRQSVDRERPSGRCVQTLLLQELPSSTRDIVFYLLRIADFRAVPHTSGPIKIR